MIHLHELNVIASDLFILDERFVRDIFIDIQLYFFIGKKVNTGNERGYAEGWGGGDWGMGSNIS